MSTNEQLIGRDDLNDLEAIMSVSAADVDEAVRVVKDNADAIFTWDYSMQRPHLRKLYEKAKVGQWNSTTDLDWSIEVDVEKQIECLNAALRLQHRSVLHYSLVAGSVIGLEYQAHAVERETAPHDCVEGAKHHWQPRARPLRRRGSPATKANRDHPAAGAASSRPRRRR